MKRSARTGFSIFFVVVLLGGGWLFLKGFPKESPAPAAIAESTGPAPLLLNIPSNQVTSPAAPVAQVTVLETVPATPAVIPAPANNAPEIAPTVTATPLGAAEARGMIAAGKKYEARAALTKLILSSPEGTARDEYRALLDTLNQELFFSRSPSQDSEFYEVKPGDALSNIAKKYGKDIYFADLILKINGMKDPRRIRAGQKLKIPMGTFSGIVQKKPHRLIILLDGTYIKEYPVALGAPASPTPIGTFKIANNKMVNPDWYTRDGKVFKFGDPENILGTRWIGFEDTDQYFGYGIHGTSLPETVGTDASDGCVRMHNADVEEVFTMLMPGNTVEIVP